MSAVLDPDQTQLVCQGCATGQDVNSGHMLNPGSLEALWSSFYWVERYFSYPPINPDQLKVSYKLEYEQCPHVVSGGYRSPVIVFISI